jgi:parallel beta-helix repeat protein
VAVILGIVLSRPPLVPATAYYVRQTVGDDEHDGLTPETAWRHVSKLSAAMAPGDTAYVGPGLYRDGVEVQHDGSRDARIVFVGDTTGQHTGDPPGIVMIAGSEPVDASRFVPSGPPGVFHGSFPDYPIWGAVEMDGPQFRYLRTSQTKEHLVDGMSELDVVARLPASYFYDESTRLLHLHTSDGAPPAAHQLELIVRGNGFLVQGKHGVTITGFTLRHMQDAGISFFKGAGDGLAFDNVAYGSRQGVRVYGSSNILLHGNVLFRNENSGAYFAAQSTSGNAIGNLCYENVKGLRWSSQSNHGSAIDNTLFDNQERGLAIEETRGLLVRRNRLVGNRVSQLLVLQSDYSSEENCFDGSSSDALVADFFPFPFQGRYRSLAEYQAAQHQDLHSREAGCSPVPAKLDVHRLAAGAAGYAERARRILAGTAEVAAEPTAATPRGSPPVSDPTSLDDRSSLAALVDYLKRLFSR